ncbi:MAG: polyhydroxyalkanoate synthesis regulator DNA-binding domain-containing protein [Hyphomonadaceae bacterium]
MSDADPAPTIELRRYPSRKLYNKSTSSYVRLPEIAELVRQGANIRVEDTETGEDVTRAVLLQIIMEQEAQPGGAMLSADVMMDMIRLHQSKASELMTSLIEQSVAFMRAQQQQIANQVSSSLAQPWSMWDPANLQDMQRDLQARMTGFWADALNAAAPSRKAEAPAEPARERADAEELKALRERLEELEKRVKG